VKDLQQHRGMAAHSRRRCFVQRQARGKTRDIEKDIELVDEANGRLDGMLGTPEDGGL